MRKKDIILIIGGISFILLIVSLVLLLGDKFHTASCGCPKVISQNFVYLFVILAVIFVGSLLYYLLSSKIDNQRAAMNKNRDILFSILDEDEKRVLREIIAGKGEVLQSEITHKLGKIQSHRVIRKLEDKKIVDVVSAGKTNKIRLKKELREEML